jgi:hypothetical protein
VRFSDAEGARVIMANGQGEPSKELNMPKEWSAKDERQYEHIKGGEVKLGRSSKRAKQIAAATVNKQRRKEGRTKTAAGRSARPKTGGRRGG